MTYWVDERAGDDCFRIYNIETRSCFGYVRRQGKNWRVEDGERVPVAVITSPSDAGSVLGDYYKKHRTWRPDNLDGNGYYKWTEFGFLQVEEEQPGCWFGYRNAEQTLMYEGEAAKFRTPEQAERAVDAHCNDGPAGPGGTRDGLSWFMYDKPRLPDASTIHESKVIS